MSAKDLPVSKDYNSPNPKLSSVIFSATFMFWVEAKIKSKNNPKPVCLVQEHRCDY